MLTSMNLSTEQAVRRTHPIHCGNSAVSEMSSFWSPQGYLWLLLGCALASWWLESASPLLMVAVVVGRQLKQDWERRRRQQELSGSNAHVVVIGAGFSGIAMAKELQDRGIRRYTILEKDESFGGTWLRNSYPGSACDIPSHLYCFSWRPNPDFSRKWATQAEILDYIKSTVDDLGILPRMRFGCRVVTVRWQEEPRRCWLLEVECATGSPAAQQLADAGYQILSQTVPSTSSAVDDLIHSPQQQRLHDHQEQASGSESEMSDWEDVGQPRPNLVSPKPSQAALTQNCSGPKPPSPLQRFLVPASVVVNCTGQLSEPQLPRGLEAQAPVFRGSQFHTARWDHSVDPRGRRVACVGSGASAIQAVPELAKVASELTVFQRSPSWIMDKDDYAYPDRIRWMFRWAPWMLVLHRWYLYWWHERAWLMMGGLRPNWANRLVQTIFLEPLLRQVSDPEILKKVRPDSVPGCKRILRSRDYLRALGRPNVRLVDRPVTAVRPEGLLDAAGELHEFDIIVWATGFRTQQLCHGMEIIGKDGLSLAQRFDHRNGGPQAYLGVCVPAMPNWFATYFVHSNLGHNSVLLMIEAQVQYIANGIGFLLGQEMAARRRLEQQQQHAKKQEDPPQQPPQQQRQTSSFTRGASQHRRSASLEVRGSSAREFTVEARTRLSGTVYASGCNSWYTLDSSKPAAQPQRPESTEPEMATAPIMPSHRHRKSFSMAEAEEKSSRESSATNLGSGLEQQDQKPPPPAVAVNNWCGTTVEYIWRLHQFNPSDYELRL